MLKDLLIKETMEEHLRARAEKEKTDFYVTDNSKCRRGLYYELTGEVPTRTPSFESINRMNMGKDIEETLLDALETHLVGRQVRVDFVINEHFNVHGYIDFLLLHDAALRVGEIKTFYGYYQNSAYLKGEPKESDVRQTAVYIWACKKGYALPNSEKTEWVMNNKLDLTKVSSEGVLFYLDRADSTAFEFKVSLIGDEIISSPVDNPGKIKRYGTIKDIMKRFDDVTGAVHHEEVPANDFQYKKPFEELYHEWADLLDNRKKSAKKSSLKKKHLPKREEWMTEEDWVEAKVRCVYGDWQCQYCDFKKTCVESQGGHLGYNAAEIKEIEAIFGRK